MTENLNFNQELPNYESTEVTSVPGFSSSYQTILTGKALEEKDEEPVEISGILSAPADFLERKKENWEPKNCHVLVDYYNGSITLKTDERTFNHNTIKGALTESRVLGKFNINTGKRYSNFELAALFRVNKYWFATPEDQSRIIAELQKFQANVSTKIKAHNDNSGNSVSSLEKEVNGISWNRTFRLNIPIFEGYPKVLVPVEIGVEPTSNDVKLFLESPELYELIESTKGGLIDEQTKRFDAWGCSVVRVS